MYSQEVNKLANLIDGDKNLCFSVKYIDEFLEETVLAPPTPENSGKKKFIEIVNKADMLGAEAIIVELYKKTAQRCANNPQITKKVRLKELNSVMNGNYLGEIGGLKGYIDTSMALEHLKTENKFLERENELLRKEIEELKQKLKDTDRRIELIEKENNELRWLLREKEIKGQNKLFEQLGSLAIGFIGQQPQIFDNVKPQSYEQPAESNSTTTGTGVAGIYNANQPES